MKIKKGKSLLIMVFLACILISGVFMAVYAEENCPNGGKHIASQEKFAYTKTSYPGPSHPRKITVWDVNKGEVEITVSCPTMIFIDVMYRECKNCHTVLVTYEVPRTECECTN